MSLGRKPVPGGETNVSRRLERMVVLVGVCWMTPMPSLLAEPSHPRATQDFLLGSIAVCVTVGFGIILLYCAMRGPFVRGVQSRLELSLGEDLTLEIVLMCETNAEEREYVAAVT